MAYRRRIGKGRRSGNIRALVLGTMASSQPHRATARSTTKPVYREARALLPALFAIYLLLLTWLVVWKLEPPHAGTGALRVVKLIPFAATADAGASDPAEVVANIAMFAPFGVYLGLLAPRLPWWRAGLAFAVASLALEAAQFALAVGSADVTDVLANAAGGLAGIGLVALAHRRAPRKTVATLSRVCAIGTVVAVLAVGLFVASPLSFTQPDVRFDRAPRLQSTG